MGKSREKKSVQKKITEINRTDIYVKSNDLKTKFNDMSCH